jgi:hypothetical protein
VREPRVHHYKTSGFRAPFQTAISLHSHTLHSRESLDFIQRATAGTPWLSGAIRKQEARYRELKGRDLNLKRAWWTPPLSARQAWDLESAQIHRMLGMDAIVSLSDHDTIEAPMHLHVLDEMRDCPISVEWTVPFRRTFFHIGVHNMPADAASAMMAAMSEFTESPQESRIGPLLEWLGAAPESLIVMNHPVWDENHIGHEAHAEHAQCFIEVFGALIHALELNGLRPWSENNLACKLAERYSLPVVSGGDRHGREPNACVNLTNASSFDEFASEVRYRGWSDVLLFPQYREPLKLRIIENMCGILEDDPNHAMGWTQWSDRVFYLTDEGDIKSLKVLWGRKFPRVVNRFVSLIQLAKHSSVKSALRLALGERPDLVLE